MDFEGLRAEMQKVHSHLKFLGFLVFLGFSLSHPAAQGDDATSAQVNLKQAAVETGKLSQMIEVTKLAGLDHPEVDPGPLTLLAPSDEAFNALPQSFRDRLLAPENRALLTDLLLYHALRGLYPTDRLLKARVRNYTVEAIGGEEIEITKNTRTREIDIAGAHIIKPDVRATDGIIHVIDKVLVPPSVLEALSAPQETPTEIASKVSQE